MIEASIWAHYRKGTHTHIYLSVYTQGYKCAGIRAQEKKS